MTRLLQNFSAWRERRRRERLERWSRTRARGKLRFVVRVWLIWSGAEIIGTSLYSYLTEGRISRLLVFLFFISGPFLGLVVWWQNEGEYTAAKLDARMKAQKTLGSNGET